jgi:PAS domain S-box-containing protein
MVRLQEVSTRLVRDDDPAPLLLAIVDAAIEVTAADTGSVRLLDPTTHKLPIVASRGLDDWFLRRFADAPSGDHVSDRLERGERVVVTDVAASELFVEEVRGTLLSVGIRALQFTPLVDRSGRLLGVLATHYHAVGGPSPHHLRLLDLLARQAADWAERTESRRALRESEERFRRFFELGLVGMAITSPNREVVAVNDRLCDLFGYSRDELLSLPWSDITHPDDLVEGNDQFERVLAGHEEGYTHEKRYIRKDGSIIDTTISLRCVREADGTVKYFIALVEDVTEHRRAEAALRASDERFRLASEALAGFIYDYDVRTDRVRRYGDMSVLGFSVDDVPEAASWWRKRIHPDDYVGARSVVRAAIGDGASSYHVNYRVQHCDGHYVDLAEEARIVRNADKSLARIVGGFRDITRRRTLERERQTLLERESAARDAAERAVRARDEIVNIVGHDLRTSLSAIDLCAASLLATRARNPKTMRVTVSAIRQAALTTDRLIHDLLDVTLLEAGRLALDPRDEHPDVILRLASDMFSAAARERGIKLRIARIPRLPLIRADKDRLVQTLGNLITNAIEHSAHGDAITLRASRAPRAVCFTVEDEGVGINAEELPHVFDRWWRGRNAAESGSGLGLSIVQGIVKAHGGAVGAQSAPGNGSRFSFTIPTVSGAP